MPEDRELSGALAVILIAHPELVTDAASAFALLDLEPDIAAVRTVILQWAKDQEGPLSAALTTAGISEDDISGLAGHMPPAVRDHVLTQANRVQAEYMWWQILSSMRIDILATELIVADRAYSSDSSDENNRRRQLLCSVMNYVVGLAAQNDDEAQPSEVPAQDRGKVSREELRNLGERTIALSRVILSAMANYQNSEDVFVVIGALGQATAQMALTVADPESFVRQVHVASSQFVQIRRQQSDLLREKAAAGTIH